MKEFRCFHECKAARTHEEIRAFWRHWDSLAADGDPLASSAGSAAPAAEAQPDSSSESLNEYRVTEREYLNLVAAGTSDEVLLEWATRTEAWDFVP